MIKWIDEKSVLKVGKEFFKAGDIIPADALSEKRIELFKSLKQLEKINKVDLGSKSKADPIVENVLSEPESKTKTKSKKQKGKPEEVNAESPEG